jgi:hypoxanthine-DNA glycosylase
MQEITKVDHLIPPVFDARSRVLVLGSFPSVKSREIEFFYGHPQNRFWRVLSMVYDCPFPQSVAQKKTLLLEQGIALWDVIASCEIIGSSDSSIRDVVPNDMRIILQAAPIERILLNGKTAQRYYEKYLAASIPLPALCLPSTSPANAAWSQERLASVWREALAI